MRFCHGGGAAKTAWPPPSGRCALDPDLAEAHAVKARQSGRRGPARARRWPRSSIALRLDPSPTRSTAMRPASELQPEPAARTPSAYYEKAAALMETDFGRPGMLISCYTALGDRRGRPPGGARSPWRGPRRRSAQDQSNGAAMGFGASAPWPSSARPSGPGSGSTAPC